MARSPPIVHTPRDGLAACCPLRRGAVARHHVRVLGTLILLVPLCGIVGIAGLATRGARAESEELILGCALLQGQPAVAACDDALSSRLAIELRSDTA